MLSGSGLHGPVTAPQFESDARAMAALALSSAPRVSEVDVWATIPQKIPSGTIVAGDLGVPTEQTVFAISVRRGAPPARAFVDERWAANLTAKPAAQLRR
jgi:hypothetical protein